MYSFTANFFENDIYLNEKRCFSSNEILSELLNLQTIDLIEIRKNLQRQEPKIELYAGMEENEIQEYNYGINRSQTLMSEVDNVFRNISLSELIVGSEKLHSQRLYDLLNTIHWLWEMGDNKDVDDDLFYSDDFSNEYGFAYYAGENHGQSQHNFYITKFLPNELKDTKIDFDCSSDIEKLNIKCKELFQTYYIFIDDILRVQELYSDFVDAFLNSKNKFLDKNQLADEFSKFIKKHEQINSKPHQRFVSGYSSSSHTVLKSKNGESILCETYNFQSLGAFLYLDFFKGITSNYIPKKCHNCDKYFLIKAGKYSNYCDDISPSDKTKTCKDIGSRKRYDDKCKNDPVWQTYNRAYKAHYARYMKKKMTISEFEKWSAWAVVIRTKAENNEIPFEEYKNEIKK